MHGKHNWSVLNSAEIGGAWHYTNRTGLRGIIQNHCLWSTARTGLNDPIEVTYPLEEMRRQWQHYRDSSDLRDDVPREDVDDLIDRLTNDIDSLDLFFTSASTDGDKVEHWKGYGSGDGYSICFDASSTWSIRAHEETQPYDVDPATSFLKWRQVNYAKFDPVFGRPLEPASGRALEEIIRGAVGQCQGRFSAQEGYQYALDFSLSELFWHKHAGYESEDEIRIDVVNPPPGTRHTRPSAYGPRAAQYIELVTSDPDAPCASILEAGADTPLLPIRAVRIGPRNTPTELADDLNHTTRILDEHGYNVPVLASPTPLSPRKVVGGLLGAITTVSQLAARRRRSPHRRRQTAPMARSLERRLRLRPAHPVLP